MYWSDATMSPWFNYSIVHFKVTHWSMNLQFWINVTWPWCPIFLICYWFDMFIFYNQFCEQDDRLYSCVILFWTLFSIMGSRVLLVSHNFTSSVSSSCMLWWSFHKFVSSLELIEFTKKAIWTWDGLYVNKFILSYQCGTFQIFCLSLCHCGEVQYSLSIRACLCLKSCTLRDHISSSSSSFTHLSSRICLIWLTLQHLLWGAFSEIICPHWIIGVCGKVTLISLLHNDQKVELPSRPWKRKEKAPLSPLQAHSFCPRVRSSVQG